MKSIGKHYKIINGNTGYAIYYYSISGDQSHDKINAELERVKSKVASENGLNATTLYWEEIADE